MYSIDNALLARQDADERQRILDDIAQCHARSTHKPLWLAGKRAIEILFVYRVKLWCKVVIHIAYDLAWRGLGGHIPSAVSEALADRLGLVMTVDGLVWRDTAVVHTSELRMMLVTQAPFYKYTTWHQLTKWGS